MLTASTRQDSIPRDPELLVIDDDEMIAQVIQEFAVLQGFNVNCVHDGSEVLNSVKQLQPDVIFLDLNLPGMDGIEVLSVLGRSRCAAKLVLMTGMDNRTLDAVSRMAKDQGLDTFATLTKPFSGDAIDQILIPLRGVVEDRPAAEAVKSTSAAVGTALLFEPHMHLGAHGHNRYDVVTMSLGWLDSTGSLVDIDAVAPDAVKARGIVNLVKFMFQEAGFAEAQWQDEGLAPQINIPIPEIWLQDEKLPDYLNQGAYQLGTSHDRISIEISQTAILNADESVITAISRLKVKGFRIVINLCEETDQLPEFLHYTMADEIVVDIADLAALLSYKGVEDTEEGIRSLVAAAREAGADASVKNLVNEAQLATAQRCGFIRVRGPHIFAPCDINILIDFFRQV